MYKSNPLVKLVNKIGYMVENEEEQIKFVVREKEDIIYTVTRIAMTMYSIEDNKGGRSFASMKNICKYVEGLVA